ncbi:MAG TPA: T9SS type A sorting domain-containing protein, partial [Steroidobacteraceae bacterium]|nr:T9SS type A sorting domain-containing protein [Steroidobacteraceae bacterium]
LLATIVSVVTLGTSNVHAQNCGFSFRGADSADSIFFSAVAGGYVGRQFTITNTSGSSLSLLIHIENEGVFRATDSDVTIAASDTLSFDIYFVPPATAAGQIIGTLSITNKTTKCNTNFVLDGIVERTPPGDITIEPHELVFDDATQGVDTCGHFTINNTSGDVAVITNIALVNSFKDLHISPAFSSPVTLKPGEYYQFTVCYTGDSTMNIDSAQVLINSTYNASAHEAIVLVSGSVKHIVTTPPSPVCLETEQEKNYLDPVLIGTTATHTFHLLNNTGHDITVTSVIIADSNATIFSVTSTFPIVVPSHSSDKVLTYTFSPTSDFGKTYYDYSSAVLELEGDSIGCREVGTELVGIVVNPNGNDTTTRPIFPSDARSLAIAGNGKPQSQRFTFENNLNVSCTIKSVRLADGTYFKIDDYNPSPLPATIGAGGNFSVSITYTATDKLVHTDSLIIEADHQLTSNIITIRGKQMQTASVETALPSGVTISVLPNPATTNVSVTLSDVRSATITVYDLLGRLVTSANAGQHWTWDASNVIAGSYIIRVNGESASGESFVSSKRIIVTK